MGQYFAADEYLARLEAARLRCAELGIDALIIGPGPDLRYLTGYRANVLERLTALLVPSDGVATLVVPKMEAGTVTASPIPDLDIAVITWEETEDPYGLTRELLAGATRVAVDDLMWAVKALALRNAMPGVEQLTAGPVMSQLRMRKSDAEIAELQRAGAAVDRVHEQVAELLVVGTSEREVARRITDLLLLEHETADFVIVASGPNSAVPHHEPSDRILQRGDVVVVDLGGTIDSGYCSDSTRTYSIGPPSKTFAQRYRSLQDAQAAARAAIAEGVTCGEVDHVARRVLHEAGLGEYFTHRTGHGIGLQTHEEPYILAGNQEPLAYGHAFSVEPGFYVEGEHGARLEDIMVCVDGAAISCNNRPRDLCVVEV